ncbi:hypothetical protein LPJ66_009460, partial [Kickxella alabastrina]
MSQRDIDSVKSKLKSLWAQYSSGSSASDSAGGTSQRDADIIEPVEELLLFPTYAYRDERLMVWRVQVRGWAYCRNPNTRRVRLAASLMRRFIRIPQGGDSDQMLLDRVSYLFAGQPASSDMVKVAMAGIAEPAPFELHMTPGRNASPKLRDAGVSPKPPRSASMQSSQAPVSLLDAPIVLTSQFDPQDGDQCKKVSQASGNPFADQESSSTTAGDSRQLTGIQPTIIQKALQIDAFAWQNLVIEEGLFEGEIMLGFNELEWLVQSYKASRMDHSDGSRRLIELRGRLFSWADSAIVTGLAHLVEPQGISVVSDIDDTIKASNITAEKRIVLETVFAKPMQAVPGMAALYQQWYEKGVEFHYVSNSPWQLYPSLDEFFHRNRFPPGSAHLRSFDPNDLLSIKNYTGTPQLKRDTIELLFRTFPKRKYVLVGDCGEQDLETYTDLARRYPDRVLRIYIRDVFAPMGVAAVTTDTDVAGNNVANGLIPYGIVRPSMSRQQGATEELEEQDLIQLNEELRQFNYLEGAHPRNKVLPLVPGIPPPVPPKPMHLSSSSGSSVSNSGNGPSMLRPSNSFPTMGPASDSAAVSAPPKPPRKTSLAQAPYIATASGTSAPALPRRPPPATAAATANGMPGGWTPSGQLANNTPQEEDNSASDSVPLNTAERIEAKVNQLREQAQEWMAFYAQQFYVAPTRSYLRYAHIFMPTVEQNMKIIDYEAVPTEFHQHYQQQQMQMQMQQQQQQQQQMQQANAENTSNAMSPAATIDLNIPANRSSGSQPRPNASSRSGSGYNTPGGTLALQGSFVIGSSYDIPEPPPPEAQLARSARRLLLWKRYLLATQGLPPALCRLF